MASNLNSAAPAYVSPSPPPWLLIAGDRLRLRVFIGLTDPRVVLKLSGFMVAEPRRAMLPSWE